MSNVGSVREWTEIAEGTAHDPCTPIFHEKSIQNKKRTEEEGRPIFEAYDYVEIHIPGEKNLRHDCRVREEDKVRWPRQYAEYKAKKEQVLDGTPIGAWPLLNIVQIAEMRALGILTVESLIQTPDGLIGKLGPNGRDLIKRAKQFLQPQTETETELRISLKEQQVDNNTLRIEMEDLKRRMDGMVAAPAGDAGDATPAKRGPGRPKVQV